MRHLPCCSSPCCSNPSSSPVDSRTATRDLTAALHRHGGSLQAAVHRLQRPFWLPVAAWFTVESVAIIVLPVCTFFLLEWVAAGRGTPAGCGWAAGIALSSLASAIARDKWQQSALAAGLRVRSGVCGLVLAKATRLHITALDEATTAELSHLMGHQAEAVGRLFYSKVGIAGQLAQILVIVGTLAVFVREAAVTAVLIVCLVIGVDHVLGKRVESTTSLLNVAKSK